MASRYIGQEVKITETGKRYIVPPIYPQRLPEDGDFSIITTLGDRYDTLASSFYGDSSLWWVIASANNGKKDSLIPTPGIQLIIPGDPNKYIQSYREFNQNR